MSHIHSVYDTDAHFKIDATTRAVKNASETKVMIVQHDHNSERFTFEIPRFVDGHDMSTCNVVQVHYINTDSTGKNNQAFGVYEVDDLQISPDSDDVVICSWLISANATQHVGKLSFVIRFVCSQDGIIDYAWNTAVNSSVNVSSGINNSEEIVEEYADVLEQWRMILEGVADIQTVNEYTEPTLTTGFVRYTSGELDSSNDVYHRTGYLEIPPNTSAITSNFVNSRSGSDGYAFYDSGKKYISGGKSISTTEGATITEIPKNAKFIALCSRVEYETDGKPRSLNFVVSKYVLNSNKPNSGYNILFMGDSIIGKYDDSVSLPTKVASISGANCFNAGFSGSCLAQQSSGAHPYRHLFSGWRLADAIVSGDFSAQLNAIAEDAQKEESDLHGNYAARLNTLQELNFSNLDVLVLSYGTNDWAASAIAHDDATEENPMGTTASFGGALRYFLEKLWSVYPNIRVLIGGIIWRGNPVNGELTTWSDKWEKDGKLIQDYNAVAKSIAENYHIPHLDMYNNMGCNHLNWRNFFDSGDATHPNDRGITFMSKLYADQLGRM